MPLPVRIEFESVRCRPCLSLTSSHILAGKHLLPRKHLSKFVELAESKCGFYAQAKDQLAIQRANSNTIRLFDPRHGICKRVSCKAIAPQIERLCNGGCKGKDGVG